MAKARKPLKSDLLALENEPLPDRLLAAMRPARDVLPDLVVRARKEQARSVTRKGNRNVGHALKKG